MDPARGLLFLAVDSVALEEGVEFFQFNPVLLKLLILRAEVTGWGFSLRPCLRAFENDLLAHTATMNGKGGRVKASGSLGRGRHIG